tara:strand:- start:1624 stop:1800 length:177 start_codon:yes stop_codon:yes gene_type:complete
MILMDVCKLKRSKKSTFLLFEKELLNGWRNMLKKNKSTNVTTEVFEEIKDSSDRKKIQ